MAWISESGILKLLVSAGTKPSIRLVVGAGGYMTDPVELKEPGTHPSVALKFYDAAEPGCSIPNSTCCNINISAAPWSVA